MSQRITVPFDLEKSTQDDVAYVFEEGLEQHIDAGWKYFSHMRYIDGIYQTPIVYTLVR